MNREGAHTDVKQIASLGVALLSFVVSVVAIFLAYRANNLTQQQIGLTQERIELAQDEIQRSHLLSTIHNEPGNDLKGYECKVSKHEARQKAARSFIGLEKDRGRTPRLLGVDLSGLTFVNADFSGVNFKDTNMNCITLRGVDLSGASLEGATLIGGRFDYAGGRGVDFSNAKLGRADFKDAEFGKSIRTAGPDFSRFAVNLSGVILTSAQNLEQDQVDLAQGDEKTVLPSGLKRPVHWPR